MTPDEIGSLLARLEAAFEHELPETTASVYADTLSDLDYESARLGVEQIIRSGGRFFPRISEIREAALEATAALPTFGEAWDEMSGKASYGALDQREPPPMSNPVVAELARQIGWENFRLSDEDDTYFMAAAERRYKDICARQKRALLTGAPALEARRQLELEGGE